MYAKTTMEGEEHSRLLINILKERFNGKDTQYDKECKRFCDEFPKKDGVDDWVPHTLK